MAPGERASGSEREPRARAQASATSFRANAPIANARPAPTTIDQLGTRRSPSR